MVINTQKNTHDQRLVMTLLIKYPLWAVYQLVVMTQLINSVGACNDHHIFFFPRNTCTFHWRKMQETSPRAMLQAIKIEIGGREVPHDCTQMGKNDQNPKNGIALLVVGRNRFQRLLVTFF